MFTFVVIINNNVKGFIKADSEANAIIKARSEYLYIGPDLEVQMMGSGE